MRQATRPALAALSETLSTIRRAARAKRRSTPPALDPDVERRLETLDARMAHLEAALEGVQDALYRQSVREDENLADLRRRTTPERIARELSADARRRGL